MALRIPARPGRNAGASPRAGYWLQRIRGCRPELAMRVEAGELSAYAAALMAGLRRKPTALELIQRQVVLLDRDELRALVRWILEHARRRR